MPGVALSSKPLHKVKGTTTAVVHPGHQPLFHRNVGKAMMISFPYVGVQNDHRYMLLVFFI